MVSYKQQYESLKKMYDELLNEQKQSQKENQDFCLKVVKETIEEKNQEIDNIRQEYETKIAELKRESSPRRYQDPFINNLSIIVDQNQLQDFMDVNFYGYKTVIQNYSVSVNLPTKTIENNENMISIGSGDDEGFYCKFCGELHGDFESFENHAKQHLLTNKLKERLDTSLIYF